MPARRDAGTAGASGKGNALVQRTGPRLGLLVTDPTLVEGLAATQAQEDLLAVLVGDRWASISLDAPRRAGPWHPVRAGGR
jgi:hypothetical protein